MNVLELVSRERKYFTGVVAFVVFVYLAMLVQAYIRYGAHDNYDPWISIQYLAVVYIGFLLALPYVYAAFRAIKGRYGSRYIVMSALVSIVWLVLFYLLSSVLFRLLGFFESEPWISPTYARYFFGREALFLLFVLSATIIYVRLKKSEPRTISGTVGRSRVAVRSDDIDWVEADDHYVVIHTPQFELLRRSTLDQMARELKPNFVRVHRKYLVNRQKVVGIEKLKRDQFVVLDSGQKIKVGRSYTSVTVNGLLLPGQDHDRHTH